MENMPQAVALTWSEYVGHMLIGLRTKVDTIKWYEDSRTKVLSIWLSVMVTTTILLLGVGTTTTSSFGYSSQKLLTTFMVLGTLVAAFTDIGTAYIKWGSIREGAKLERELGLNLGLFHDFDSSWVREARFFFSYIAGIIFSTNAAVHAYNLV